MDATQAINDSILESDEEQNEEQDYSKRGRPLAKLCILKNPHIPETELPLFLGDNVLGRDPSICTLPLTASSVSKQHATICISVFRRRGCHSEVDTEALVWDLGSMNGTRKGRLKLTPNVRYALSEGDSLVLADIPCQYVSCGADSVSSQDDMRTSGSRSSRVKAMLPDASGGKLGDTDTGSKKCVNGGEKAKKTPVRGGCLSFEQTPTQPQGSLVSESDSDSETGGREDRRQKIRVSDSDSHKSSPTSSTFFSPLNKIVPESEDESPLTPSSSTRSNRHVSFSTEKAGDDVETNKSPTCVEISEEEEGRGPQGGTHSEESGHHAKPKGNMSFTGSALSTPEVSRDAIPEFNMDSDTDVEGEVAPAGTLNQQVHQPLTVQFHMDSDTDEDISDKPPKTGPISNDTTKPSSSIQPECIIMNSDTDDDVSDSVTAAKASSFHGAPTADSAPSMQPSDFHLDSDTDVDEDDDGGCGTKSENSQTDETLIKAESGVVVHGSSASPHNLHSNANTGRADVCSRAAADPSVASALTESCVAAAAGADLDILSDSDTDEEDDSLQVIPAAVTNLSGISGKTSDPLKSDSGTDVDEPCVPRAGDNQADPEVESDTDVEDVEADVDKSPHLQREQTLRSLVLPQQNCSTPIRVSERKVEDMDTQAFTSPSSGAFRRAEAPIMSCSDSQDDEDYAVAETQSFVLQTRDQQTGVNPNPAPALEDRSHLQCHGSALENIQAHASDEGGVSLEETQAYEAMSAPENDSDLEATQAYAEDEEPVRDSRVSEKESCVNLAFEATQVYISESYSDSEGDSDKRQNTDPTGSLFTLATAGTQPVTSFEEDNLNIVDPICSVQHAKPRIKSETEEKEAAQPQEPHAAEAGSLAETQPMCPSDDEDLLNPPELKEEQRQLQTCSSSSLAATQPMDISMDETQPMVLCENEDEDSMPLLRKRKAKQLHTDEEELTNSDVCTAETQPIVKSESDDDDDSMPGPRKRKAKPLQLEDETQSLVNSDVSAVESQPATTGEGEQRDKPRRPQTGSEVSCVRTHPEVRAEEENNSEVLVIPRKRKAKQLHIEDEESQQIIKSEYSVTETQPTCEIKHEEEETKPPITTEVSDVKIQSNKDDESQTRSAKQQHLKDEEAEPISQSDDSPGETSMKTTTDGTKKLQVPNSRRTRARFREEEAECSAAPKTQTKKESKTPATRGRRGKAMTRDENSEEEGKQSKQEDEEQQRTEETENERVATDDRGRKQEEVEEELENEERLQVEDAAWKELDREKKEQEHQTRLKEEKQVSQKNKGEEEMLNIPARGRRATRKTAEPQQNSVVSTEEDVPARRTRSRSNSSNSVSSERSASRVNAQESKGRGRGRGAKRTSETLQTTRNTRRRVTVVAGLTEQDGSNSSISVSSSISRQTGDELQGRARRTRSDRHVVAPDVSDRSSTARGRKSGKMVASSSELRQENDTKKANARQATTSRGQQQVNSSTSQPALRQDEGQLSQDKSLVDETTPLSKRNVKVKGQKVENLDKPVASSVSDGDAACSKRKGRTSELETHTEANSVSTGTNRVQKTTEEESKDEPKQEIPANIQFRRTSRASSTQVKKNIKESPSEKEVGAAERKTRGRNSAVQRNKKEEDADVEASEQPKTPRSHVSRKRQASSDSSPLAKTPRSSSCSPTASVRLRAGKRPTRFGDGVCSAGLQRVNTSVKLRFFQVLFTGVVDEAGQEVLAQLGGSMAKGVADMNCLVTDKVRRTVKFLCAVAKGVPVVTTDWLEKSGKAGSFLSPNAFIVKDPDQEKKFSFCLQESLRTARTQPLLQGYEIHVTKSVKPEPVHMKDIISCSGATFLPKMPSSHKPQTVVISCEEDRRLCGPAVSASLPVVTAEFILTGILQQQLDFQTHALSPPPSSDSQPSGDRGRSRRKI